MQINDKESFSLLTLGLKTVLIPLSKLKTIYFINLDKRITSVNP